MKKYFTLLFFAVATVLSFSLQSCCEAGEDQPVVPPSPEVHKPAIAGTVTTNGGAVLPGATIEITINGETTTVVSGADGTFEKKDLPTGSIAYLRCYMAGSQDYSEASGTQVIDMDNTTYYWYPCLMKANTIVETYSGDTKYGDTPVGEIDACQLPNFVDRGSGEASSITNDYSYAVIYNRQEDLSKDPSVSLKLRTMLNVQEISNVASKAAGDTKNYRVDISSTASLSNDAAETENEIMVAFNVEYRPDSIYFTDVNGKTSSIDPMSLQETYLSYNNKTVKVFYFWTKKMGTTSFIYHVTANWERESSSALVFDPAYIDGPVSSATSSYTYQLGWYADAQAGDPTKSTFIRDLIATYCGNFILYHYTSTTSQGFIPEGYRVTFTGGQYYTQWHYYLTDTPSVSLTVLNYTYNMVTAKMSESRAHTGGSN